MDINSVSSADFGVALIRSVCPLKTERKKSGRQRNAGGISGEGTPTSGEKGSAASGEHAERIRA